MSLPRKLLVLVLVLTALYAVFGFLIFPPLIRHLGEKALQENVGEQSVITKVRANPFLWKLEIEGLKVAEPSGACTVEVERMLVDLSALSLFKFYPVLDAIELDAPDISVVRLPVEVKSVEETSEPAASNWREQIAELNTLEIPKLSIDLLEVRDGRVDFIDKTTETPYEQEVESLSFTLRDFTTVVDSENAMQFMAETETGATLSWSGIVTSQPITSAGTVEIGGLKLDHLSPYYEQFLRFDLKSAVYEMRFDYALDLSQPENLFQLTEGFIGLSDVLCVPTEVADRILSIEQIGLEGLNFAFPQMELAASRFYIENGETRIERAGDGSLNLMHLIALPEEPEEAPEESAAPPSDLKPLNVLVNLVELTNYKVIWVDNLESGQAVLEIGIPSARVEGVFSDIEKPLKLSAQYTIGDTGKASVAGSVTPGNQNIALALKVESLPLGLALPYTNEFAQTKIESGLYHYEGTLESTQPGVFKLTGSGNVDTFKAVREGDSPMEFGFDSVAWENLVAVTEPLSLKIDSVLIEKPNGVIRQLASTVDEAPEEVEATEEAEVVESEQSALPDVWIGSIEVKDGAFALQDESVEPNTTTELAELNVSIQDFATLSEAPSTLEASAAVNGAPFEMDGSFYIGDLKKESAFSFTLKDLSLPAFSSYSGQAVGRRIAKGRFGLESNWTIVGAQLKAQNQILIEQIELGDTVENDTAIRLPLDFAITLLKDASGAIDVKLPLSGDLSDPKASVGQIVIKACVGLVTNVAAAPFKLLSGLAGSEKDLSQISFVAGDATLSDSVIDSLNALATALKERPQLKLKIVPQVVPADLDALRLAEVRAKFAEGLSDGNTAGFIKKLQSAYVEKMKATNAAPEAYVLKSDPEAESKMLAAFLPDVNLTDLQKAALTTQRAEAVKNHLLTSHAVAPERLVVAEAEVLEEGDAGLRFDLE